MNVIVNIIYRIIYRITQFTELNHLLLILTIVSKNELEKCNDIRKTQI